MCFLVSIPLVRYIFVFRKISCKVSSFITSKANVIRQIFVRLSSVFILVRVLTFMMVYSAFLGLYCESLIFTSHLLFRASSWEHSSHNLLNLTNLFLAQIPWMKESHVLGRPFKVVITIFAFSTSSSTASSCSLIWETLVKYDWMVSLLWIFTIFNWFLRVIFQLMFFPSNRLVRESNIALGVLREDTCGMRRSLIQSAIILFTITNFFLCKALASSPFGAGTSSLI